MCLAGEKNADFYQNLVELQALDPFVFENY